ncbi:hypothetical protein D3C87_666400 [compost metagenome]
MKIKRDRRGIRVPGMRNRLNGDDSLGLYALMDWYCQGHLTFDDVKDRLIKYADLYHKTHDAYFKGRDTDRHRRQVNTLEIKVTTLMLVLKDWDQRKFS